MKHFSELCIMRHQNEKDRSTSFEDQRLHQELVRLCPVHKTGVLCGKYSLCGYIIFIVRVTQYKVCYWLIFVFYYHCNFTC